MTNNANNRPPPRFGDKLPVAPARIAALKASYRQAWLYLLLILCLAVAWWVPLRYAFLRWLVFRPAPVGERDAQAFVALAYAGISHQEGDVKPEEFRAHINALRKAGYHAITLRDVQDFYRNQRPLPRKAVLLTFDQSRKSSYFDARRVLRRAGWPAVMFLWTKPIEEKDPSALRWPYVVSMLRSGAWDIGAQGHNGFSLLPADGEGRQRNFMSAPRWLAGEMHYETPESFRQRIEAEHEQCRRIIADAVGRPPQAYAFPYGDFGQYDERAIFVRRLNLELVGRYYALGFIHGNAALNTRASDPRRLNRLLVQPSWTAADLLQRLEHAWPKSTGYTSAEVLNSDLYWAADWGSLQCSDQAAELHAGTNTTGAKAWLNGSDLLDSFHARLKITLPAGQFGFFCRATPDGETYLYLGIGNDGNAWLRQKHAGLPPFTLGSGRCAPGPDGVFDLEICLRDRLFFAAVDGHALFPEVINTSGAIKPGMIGCSVWHPQPGLARAAIRQFELQKLQPAFLTWDHLDSRGPALPAWLSRNAYCFTAMAPPWLRISRRGPHEQFGWDAPFFLDLARIYRLAFTPRVVLENLDDAGRDLPEQIASAAAALPASGILCDLGELEDTFSLARITEWLQLLSDALSRHHLSLVVHMALPLEKPAALATLFQGITNLTVATTTSAPLLREILPQGPERLAALSNAEEEIRRTASFYYQVAATNSTPADWTANAGATRLRDDGYAAFRRGAFDTALAAWEQWRAIEPRNGEPPALIGDIYLHRNEIDRAVEYYQKSLELAPGQIELALRCARLMYTKTDQSAAAYALLDLYTQLFPDNAAIIAEQIEWLVFHKQKEKARAKAEQLVKAFPDDLEARALYHRFLDTPKERATNLAEFLAATRRTHSEAQAMDIIRRWELLAWPESCRLLDAAQEASTRLHIPSFAPRSASAREEFRRGMLSSNWTLYAASAGANEADHSLAAPPTQTEAALQLVGSETMLNGFIEATVDDARGFLWLYARRSQHGMIRFGFEQTGRIYLQVWQDGRLLTHQNRSWSKPAGTIRLRLEVRGGGAFAYVNDLPAFSAPLAVPASLGLGWWGIGPWSPQFGVAQALLREIAGGPLPVRLAFCSPRDPPWTDNDYLQTLKPWTTSLCAVAPSWFVQELDGTIRKELPNEYPDLRILCRYYQIRILPIIRTASPHALDIRQLIEMAHTHQVNGFTLFFTRLPDAAWLAAAEAALLGSETILLAAALDEEAQTVTIREIGSAFGFFAGPRRTIQIPLTKTAPEPSRALTPANLPPTDDTVLWF